MFKKSALRSQDSACSNIGYADRFEIDQPHIPTSEGVFIKKPGRVIVKRDPKRRGTSEKKSCLANIPPGVPMTQLIVTRGKKSGKSRGGGGERTGRKGQ